MPQRDYYEVLGVPRNASSDDVKSAFRKLARQYHPDVSQEPNAEERFKEVNEAYAVLSEPDKRAAYDRFGHAGVQNTGGVPDFTVDFADLFEEFFGGFGGFGRTSSRRARNAPRRGGDLQYNADLTFEESIFGVEKEIEITNAVLKKITGKDPKGFRAPNFSLNKKTSFKHGRGKLRNMRMFVEYRK